MKSDQTFLVLGGAGLVFEVGEGGAGDDPIDAGAVTDTLNGDNTSAAEYASASAAVSVNLATGAATGGAGNDTLLNITQARGSAYNDTLTGSNTSLLTEQFEGRGGNDTIDGAGGLDLVRYYSATAGVRVNLATGVATITNEWLKSLRQLIRGLLASRQKSDCSPSISVFGRSL